MRYGLAMLAGVGFGVCATGTRAGDDMAAAEAWSGVQVTGSSWYAYSGVVYALGSDVLANGWRLRATGGGGGYSYEGRLPSQPAEAPDTMFTGTPTDAGIALGYQQRFDWIIAKVYLGASYADHRIVPEDVFNSVSGTAFGAVAAADVWAEIDERTWASLCASFDTAYSRYMATASAGYRVMPELSLGIEVGAFGNETLDAGRLGALLKWNTAYGELTAAAGVSGDYADPSTPYGRVSWNVRF